MKNKLVVFDIDGTLLNHDKQMPQSTRLAIEMLQKTGINIAIATGRGSFMFKEMREELGITNYIAFNGQLAIMGDKVIYSNPLPEHLCESILEDCDENDIPLLFLSAIEMKSSKAGHPLVKEALDSLFIKYPSKQPDFYKGNSIYQSLMFCEEGEQELNLAKKYEGKLHFIRWHKYSIDVLPQGGSKARGIEALMKELNIEQQEVYAFGDGLNDLEMIEFAGKGIVMGNAGDKLKALADFVTTDVDDDGIMNGLKWAGLL